MDKIQIDLDPINICMVAPMGAGKTSILSTLMTYIKKNLKEAQGFSIRASAQDEKILSKFDQDLATYLGAGSFNIETGNVLEPNRNVSRKFEFEISLNSKADTKVSQKIVIMDYPGGWIQESNAHDDFLEHLKISRILWIPIDSPVMMQTDYNDAQEKGWMEERLCKESIKELVKIWADFREEDFKNTNALSCANFVMTKCETYFSHSLNKTRSFDVKKRFDDNYKSIVQQIHAESPATEIFYFPVDTIGSVKIINSDWNKGILDTKYAITNKERSIRGASLLLKSIIDYSAAQIQSELDAIGESADKVLNTDSWIYKIWNMISGKSKLARYQKEEIKKIVPCMTELGEKMVKLKEFDLEYNQYFQNL